jgi:plastocyanin
MRRTRLALATGAVAVTALAAALPAASAPAGPAKVVRVTVAMREFSFTLSKRSVPRGTTVVFTVINRGQVAHDFDFVTGIKKGMPVIGPGKRFTYRLTFKRKGRYGYICTVPRHAQDGMAGQFVVR